MEFDSGAEPEMCHMYLGDEEENLDRPIIYISCEDFAYDAMEEFQESGSVNAPDFKPVSLGKMLFFARVKDYYDHQTMAYYAFEQGDDKDPRAISLTYCKDLIGTPLEKKLLTILEHTAETYKEF